MKKIALLTSAMAVLFAGAASAESLTDTTQVELTVESACMFGVVNDYMQSSLNVTGDPSAGSIAVQPGSQMLGKITVVCTNGVPYVIESDALLGGRLNLLGDNTGTTVPAYLYQGDFSSTIPLGQMANAEHMYGFANGEMQTYDFTLAMNYNEDGTVRALPAADIYRDEINWTFSY